MHLVFVYFLSTPKRNTYIVFGKPKGGTCRRKRKKEGEVQFRSPRRGGGEIRSEREEGLSSPEGNFLPLLKRKAWQTLRAQGVLGGGKTAESRGEVSPSANIKKSSSVM